MASPSDLNMTTSCSHCGREIPSLNIDLHYVHCSRNLKKCNVCEEMVPISLSDEHYLEAHAPIDCSLCKERVEREAFDLHKGQKCPQRIVTCEYCEFPLPAIDLFEHQEICGNRTELCNLCSKYIRLREMVVHERRHLDCLYPPAAPPSRDAQPSERDEPAAPPRRRQPRNSRPKGLLLTIAVAGIAVLIGTIVLQRKGHPHQQQH